MTSKAKAGNWLVLPLSLLLLLLIVAANLVAASDFRHIAFDDLSEKQSFEQEGVAAYSQLLFDVARQQVVVGARDNLYRLTLTSLTPLEHAAWPASRDKSEICQAKGQSIDDCRNYVKVLLSNGKKLFTCGTNAFSPQCSWREIENINSASKPIAGVAMCPYSPHSNVTALLSRGPGGGLFAGTPTDFSGADTAIYRSLVTPHLRTRQYDSKWLNDPQFVGSFETENYIYFLFRESAVEYINCGKRIYSRIGRVCKHDQGSPMLMKDTWTTFSKARLNCSLPGEFPFYYDEIQGAAYHAEEGLVYATFTTPSNAIAGSAICAFNMSAIEAAFNGPYKHQEHSGAAWERKPVQHQHGQAKCGQQHSSAGGAHQDKSSQHVLTDNQRYQLMDEAVQPISPRPLHTTTLERFSHLAVDVTPTKRHRAVAVLYVSTSSGTIKKISVLPGSLETCIVEVWGPLPSAPITLQFLKETKSLYVGMQNSLLRIPTVQCHRHRDAQSCLNAQEPYCGWDEHLMRCAPAPSQTPGGYQSNHWKQELDKCPVLDGPINGGWSAWGSWRSCQFESGQAAARSANDNENTDSCMCRTRECNNPEPKNGGESCKGAQVRVTNCTVHGGWTDWSDWSGCNKNCGLALKTRRRTCSNPTPQHGGRVCLGADHEEAYCNDLPPCSLHGDKIAAAPAAVAPATPAKGVWSDYGPWTSCSKKCGGGFRTRRRTCEPQSRHKDSKVECVGCDFQIEECNLHACPEPKRFLSTPWILAGNSSSDTRLEKRYRFACKASTDDISSIKIQAKEEERHCRPDGSCTRRPAPASNLNLEASADSSWNDWSPWSACSQTCGGGIQYRMKNCDTSTCEGPMTESRPCNTKPCRLTFSQQTDSSLEITEQSATTTGQWSCWTDWTECSAVCGFGLRSRTRVCLGPGECQGLSSMTESCEMPSCEYFRGWDEWSAWTPCDSSNSQHRKRKCTVQPNGEDCIGPTKQTRWCANEFYGNDVNALPSRVETAGVAVGAVVGSCIIGFLLGLLMTAIICFYYMKRKKPGLPSNPHYISRQNPYVTVPLKEQVKQTNNKPVKRQPSFTGSINGTLRSIKNNSLINGGHHHSNHQCNHHHHHHSHHHSCNGVNSLPKLYPKALEYESATLKRNSREAVIRAELDQYY
ncbi:hypothetical protein TKK_0006159 [Trichogramma kaykai]